METILQEFWKNLSKEEQESVIKLYSRVEEEGEFIGRNKVLDMMHTLFGENNLNPKITYDDIYHKLFDAGRDDGCIIDITIPTFSDAYAEKLSALNALICTAKYLNGDWKPDWSNPDEYKWLLTYDAVHDDLSCEFDLSVCTSAVYFYSEKLAHKAVEILGKETIIKALSSDY